MSNQLWTYGNLRVWDYTYGFICFTLQVSLWSLNCIFSRQWDFCMFLQNKVVHGNWEVGKGWSELQVSDTGNVGNACARGNRREFEKWPLDQMWPLGCFFVTLTTNALIWAQPLLASPHLTPECNLLKAQETKPKETLLFCFLFS